MRMKKLKKDQRGFTLLELLIGIAITGLITTAITMAIFQTFTGSARSSNHMIAVRQVQEAGYWVSLYTYMAQDATITGDSGFPLILRWVDFDTGENHEVEFGLDSSGLRGSYSIGGSVDPEKTGKIPVFEVVNPDQTKTNCQVSGGSVFSLPDIGDEFTITVTAGAIDNGRITVRSGSISVTPTGSATYNPTTREWETTTTAGGTITVTAMSSGTTGSWTSETKAATTAITVDADEDATLSSAKGLIFTVTATVGTGIVKEEETRIYKVVPKPSS
jgi:prepilin-type N-terminal cleavage/methylation domain-containing protein